MAATANTIGGASTTTTAPLPVASTIDATQDLIPIYTASAQATQAISRNTYLGITGNPVGTTDSQTLSNKTLGNSNALTVKDGGFTLQNTADTTKQGKFSLSGLTTGNTRTYTLPDYNATLASLAGAETLTNKTLTSPTINSPTITNATITADTVAGFTASTTGTIYGISITGGNFTSLPGSNILSNANVTAGSLFTSKVFNPYKFSVYLANALTITGTLKITFDTKEYDTGTNFDVATNHRFTAPVTGFYRFSCAVGILTSAAAVFNVQLYKNGSVFKTLSQTTTNSVNTALGGAVTLSLTANDYIEIYCLLASGSQSANTGQANTWFCGELVSAT